MLFYLTYLLFTTQIKTMKRRYWIGVASLNHVQISVSEGFSQVCHGKKQPLQRMKKNDVIFYYSPTIRLGSNDKCQCFTAMGRIRDDKVYQVEVSSDFVPFRRHVEFYLAIQHAPIHNLISQLDFIENKVKYGEKFRFGLFEVSKKDAITIWNEMKVNKEQV